MMKWRDEIRVHDDMIVVVVVVGLTHVCGRLVSVNTHHISSVVSNTQRFTRYLQWGQSAIVVVAVVVVHEDALGPG